MFHFLRAINLDNKCNYIIYNDDTSNSIPTSIFISINFVNT